MFMLFFFLTDYLMRLMLAITFFVFFLWGCCQLKKKLN